MQETDYLVVGAGASGLAFAAAPAAVERFVTHLPAAIERLGSLSASSAAQE